MPIRSLRTRLGLFWLLIVATCVSLGLIMLEVYRQGAGVEVDDANRATAQACAAIRDGYARSQPAERGQPFGLGEFRRSQVRTLVM